MKKYYVYTPGNTPQGPFPESMVRDAFIHGIYDDDTMVCEENTSQWIFIKSAFPTDSLNQSPGANKKYSLWGRTLRGIGFFIILLILIGLAVGCGCPKEVIAFIYFAWMGVWDAWDTRMKYGISWETASKSSITFWTVAFLIFIIIYISFSPKSLPKGLPMILVLIISVRYHMLKKKYGSPK